jgi:hypothetical protein
LYRYQNTKTNFLCFDKQHGFRPISHPGSEADGLPLLYRADHFLKVVGPIKSSTDFWVGIIGGGLLSKPGHRPAGLQGAGDPAEHLPYRDPPST